MSEPQSLLDESIQPEPPPPEEEAQSILEQHEQEQQEEQAPPVEEVVKEIPESYELNINSEYGDLNIHQDDPLVKEAMGLAKEAELTQDVFDRFMDLYAQTRIQDQEYEAEYVQEQLRELGGYGKERIKKVGQWVNANVPEDFRQGIMEMATTAKSFEALEYLIGVQGPASLSSREFEPEPATSIDRLKQMQFAVDSQGNRLMVIDKEYQQRVNELAEKLYSS